MNIWLVLAAFFGAIALFVFGWMQVPWNRAKIYRMVSPKKNWRIVQLVMPGGQVRFAVVPADKPVVTQGEYSFPLSAPNAKLATNYIGSVPLQCFSTEDTNPIYLAPKTHVKDEPFRNPAHLTNFLMMMKAFYEAMASRQQDLLKILIIACLAVSAIALVIGYQNNQVLQELLPLVKSQAAQASQSLVNQLGG
jgi:hypothetical protein